MKYLDRNGIPLIEGAQVSIQYCVGPCGHRERITGVLFNIDDSGRITIVLDHPHKWLYKNVIISENRGDKFYVASVFTVNDGVAIGFKRHDDFEYQCDSWVEIT